VLSRARHLAAADPASLTRHDEALLALDAREANKRADYARDLIDAATLRVALELIDAEREALERQRADLARGTSEWTAIWNQTEELNDFDWQRNAIRSVVERVTVRPSENGGNEPQTNRITITYYDGRREGGAALAERLGEVR
jgi:hypothetical protein